jgi:hypothetical protein
VNGPRHQLLAGTGLTGDQDIDVRTCDLVNRIEHHLHRVALTDHVAECVAALHLSAQQPVLIAQTP